ncbi:hypothetical protein EK904_007012 [Melospiza melodia maxima]|nr:hypothetical protein EK904_007012 [Melospiza melodia maxima]
MGGQQKIWFPWTDSRAFCALSLNGSNVTQRWSSQPGLIALDQQDQLCNAGSLTVLLDGIPVEPQELRALCTNASRADLEAEEHFRQTQNPSRKRRSFRAREDLRSVCLEFEVLHPSMFL